MFEYVTQGQIGKRFGVSSHVIGRWLVTIGLRNFDKTPSEKALQGGFFKEHYDQDRGIHFPVWHADKTIAALDDLFCSLGGAQNQESEKGT